MNILIISIQTVILQDNQNFIPKRVYSVKWGIFVGTEIFPITSHHLLSVISNSENWQNSICLLWWLDNLCTDCKKTISDRRPLIFPTAIVDDCSNINDNHLRHYVSCHWLLNSNFTFFCLTKYFPTFIFSIVSP